MNILMHLHARSVQLGSLFQSVAEGITAAELRQITRAQNTSDPEGRILKDQFAEHYDRELGEPFTLIHDYGGEPDLRTDGLALYISEMDSLSPPLVIPYVIFDVILLGGNAETLFDDFVKKQIEAVRENLHDSHTNLMVRRGIAAALAPIVTDEEVSLLKFENQSALNKASEDVVLRLRHMGLVQALTGGYLVSTDLGNNVVRAKENL